MSIINDFIYKYDLILEDNDIIQRFNEIYSTQQLFITEKIYLYNFYLNNKENINMLKNIINDFKIILIHLISLKENDDNVKITDIENKKISEIMKNITKEIISDDFSNLIKSSEFLVGKLANMFEYYLMIIFPTLIGEISLYQIELENEKKKLIELHFQRKDILITKEIFALSTRLFILLFLFNKNDKEKSIKDNTNNIINYYIKIPDIWNSEFLKTKDIFNFEQDKWKSELDDIRKIDIKINQIIKLEEIIGNDIEESYFKDLREEIKKIKMKEEQNKFAVDMNDDEFDIGKNLNMNNEEEKEEEYEEEKEEREGKGENEENEEKEEEDEEEEEFFQRKKKKNYDYGDLDRD